MTSFDLIFSACFACAIIHTFLSGWLRKMASRFPNGSVGENALHALGEVELVFGLWAGIALVIAGVFGGGGSVEYLASRSFTEAAFVFVIMVACATRPILDLATRMISGVAARLPLKGGSAFFFSALVVGPLLGSLITEPAAMTVTALLVAPWLSRASMSLRYAVIGCLFVNVSVGGVLTPFAAPPVLMVAARWNWDVVHMLTHFGWRGVLTCVGSAVFLVLVHGRELKGLARPAQTAAAARVPWWMIVMHLAFVAAIVAAAHHMVIFIGIFCVFVGVAHATREYQSALRLREGLLVAFFLAGLIVLGGPQKWWLEPFLMRLSDWTLYVSAIGLTAIVDNAAITYLGSQVPNLSESARYFLVAGSVVGGGLTVIANAPNPIGYGILGPCFGESGVGAWGLLKAALVPTLIAAAIFAL